MRLKQLLLPALLVCFSFSIKAQTTLSEGDIAIIAMDGFNGYFSFVTFVDLEAGTEIYFTNYTGRTYAGGTEYGLTGPSGGGLLLYTVPAGGVSAGTVMEVDEDALPASFTETETGFDRVSSGDKLIVFQGWEDGMAFRRVTTYIFALSSYSDAGVFPPAFTTIVNFDPGPSDGTADDGEYTGNRNSTQADLLTDISNTANWSIVGSGTGVYPFDNTNFRIGYYWDGSTWTPSQPTGTLLSEDIYVDGTTTLGISGNVTTTGKLYVEPNAQLTVLNTLTADSIIIMSDATGQGQIAGNITADAEFQSYLDGSARWFNIGSPVNGALSTISFTNGGFIRTVNDLDSISANIYYYDPDTQDGVTGEGKWIPAADQTPLSNANGWSVYLGGGSFGTLPMTISTFGALDADGSVTTTLSDANGGWNLCK
jgi:hypothetical protein